MTRKLKTTTRGILNQGKKFKLIKATVVDENGVTHVACPCSGCGAIGPLKDFKAYHNYGGSRKEVIRCDNCFKLAFENCGYGRVSRIKKEICSYTCSNFRKPPNERF